MTSPSERAARFERNLHRPDPICEVCGHPVIFAGDHTPERHNAVGIADLRDPLSELVDAMPPLDQTVGEAYAEAAAIADEYVATIYPDGTISFTEPPYTVHQHGSVVLVDFPPSAGRIGHLAAVRFPYEAMADAFVRSLR